MNYIITMLVFLAVYGFDQVSKYLVEANIADGESITLIPNLITITKSYNTGMAWSMLSNTTGTIILAIVSLVASIVLGYFAMKNDWKKKPLRSIAITFALAGCFGNLYDRFCTVFGVRKGVIDMIHVSFGTTIFNVADFFLVTGLCLIILEFVIDMLTQKDKKGD